MLLHRRACECSRHQSADFTYGKRFENTLCVQASQQARAHANNIQRYAPGQTPSAAIAAAGGQAPPGFRMPTAKQHPIGLPSERLGAMGGQARTSAGD
jgi:hypothetical protein